MTSEIPFDMIKDTGDRSWSSRLVEELSGGGESNRAKIIETLIEVADPRTEQPLLAIVLDSRKTDAVRMAASDALFTMGSHETEEERAQWWGSNDPVISRHALLMSEPSESARVTSIAADPTHSLYHEAIRRLEFWEPPEFQKLVIQALDHQNPRVRETAARCLLWKQPVAGERRLLELARDADEAVAIAALDTLIYCSSREIILELDNLRRNGPESLRDCYENTFSYVQSEFRWALPGSKTEPEEKAYMLEWLKPIKHLLPKKRREKSHTTKKPKQSEAQPEKVEPSALSIIDDLSEMDGLWYQKQHRYYGVGWAAFNDPDRLLLKRFFEQHADSKVRKIGCRAFSAWQDVDAILFKLHDHDFGVLASAAYNSRFLQPNSAVARRLKELIVNPNVMNTFAREALESYIYHVKSSETYDWLLELARHDSRPSIRQIAASELSVSRSQNRLKQLVPILDEPPVNTWGVHCAILRSCERSWLSQSTLDYLKSIDNLDLQIELSSFFAN